MLKVLLRSAVIPVQKRDPYNLFKKLKEKSTDSSTIIERIKGSETTPLWNLAIDTAGKEGKGSTAIWKMYNTMKKRHIKPNNQTFTIMFKYLSSTSAFANNERLIKLFGQIPDVNEIHVNSFMKALCFNGFYDTFFAAFYQLRDSQPYDSKNLLTTLPSLPMNTVKSKLENFSANPLIFKSGFSGLLRCPIYAWKENDSDLIAFRQLWKDLIRRIKLGNNVHDGLVHLSIIDYLKKRIKSKKDVRQLLEELDEAKKLRFQ
eukprot:NODE_298_length_10484_cov_0.802600.p8 type:complete len:260 gc:universal NODE_298_length_10484_cov_0.802600:4724-5503(+)